MVTHTRTRIHPLDIVVSFIIVAFCVLVIYRIKTGLHYEWSWSTIPQYILRFDEASSRWVPNILLKGLLTTLRLSIWGIILATILGIFIGICRVSQSLFLKMIGRTYIELIRNLPPLVLIFIFYFFVGEQIMAYLDVDGFIQSQSEGVQSFLAVLFSPSPHFSAFLSALLTLALFESAFIAEIVRAGIQSIEKGQWEASHALGLSGWHQMRYVILPQAIQRSLPPMAGQFISTIKDSAIVSVISIQELTFQGMELMSSTYLIFEIWITITVMYFVLNFFVSLAVERLERRLDVA